MKIAELFVALGFKVEGEGQLQRVDQNLNKATLSAGGLLAAVTAVNAAFYLMMNRAVDAAVGLDRWQKTTGGSIETLQQWEYGARKANVAAGTVADAIKQIQKTRADISLGNTEASQPWFLLGIDPRQDPLKVLAQLRTALTGMDPALARTMTSRMGLSEDMHYLLMQKQQFGSLFVTQAEVDRLTKLGGAWKAFTFNVATAVTKFASAFADGMQRVLMHLDKIVTLFARFTTWLNSGTAAANGLKTVLGLIVIFLGLAAVALTGVVFLLGLLKMVLIAIQLLPIVAALSAIVVVLALMGAGIVALVLLIQDFWTQIDGGKSLFDWNENLILSVRNVERLAKAMEWVRDTAGAMGRAIKSHFSSDRGYGFGAMGEAMFGNPDGYKAGLARPRMSPSSGGGNSNSAKIDIHVDGARDPIVTGREVGRSVSRELSDSLGMAPLPTN